MNTLNLLSPAQKAALISRVRYALLERFMVTLVLSTLVATGVTVSVKAQLASNLEDVVARQMLSAQYASLNEQVRALNDALVRVDAIQKLAYPLSDVVEAIGAGAPPGISVSSIDFDTRTGMLAMTGIASDRAALLGYEEALRALPFVASFESPISNLFQKENVSFKFSATVDRDKVRETLESPAP